MATRLLFFLPLCQPVGMIRKFNALGRKDKGKEWGKKRPDLVRSFTSDREGGPIGNYKELTRDEMQTLIDGMF